MTINVTEEDIRDYRETSWDSECCPVTIAARRAYKDQEITCDFFSLRFGSRGHIKLPEEVKEFQRNLFLPPSMAKPCEPITFELKGDPEK